MPPARLSDDFRERLTAFFSRLDGGCGGKIPGATLATLMRKLQMDESEISALMQHGDGDGMVDYRRFVDWVIADSGKLLAEDVLAEVSRATAQSNGQGKRDWQLEDVLGGAVGTLIVEALRPNGAAASPSADWQLLLMQALGRRGGAAPAVKHILEGSGFVDRLAETIAQCAKNIHDSGSPQPTFHPPARQQGERKTLNKQSTLSRIRATTRTQQSSGSTRATRATRVTQHSNNSGNSKPGSTYVGSYGLLTGFIQLVKETEAIEMTDEELNELLAAVENCSKQGGRASLTSANEHFDGFDNDIVNSMLMNTGVLVDDGMTVGRMLSTLAVGRARSTSADHHISQPIEDPLAIAEVNQMFSSFHFDQQARSDYRKDIAALIYGFHKPDNLLERYCIQDSVLAAWCLAMRNLYKPNPYHSWLHAVDVFQFTYVALTQGKATKFFNRQDIVALFMAQIGHDVGHLGLNNVFLKTTGHELAITYNDHSPLENMHSSVVFKELAKEGQRVFDKLSKHDWANVREKVIVAILATDMAHHFDLVDRFAARVAQNENEPFHYDTSDNRDRQQQSKADRRMLLQAFIHTADLGHCARPWDVHKHLVAALEEEMFRQGDTEAQLGVPVSPLMNRSADSMAAGQDFFFTKFVTPLLVPYTFFLDEEVGKQLLDNLDSNCDEWRDRIAIHGKKTAADLLAIEQ